MALTKCPDCEKEISDQATSCVHCGRPMRRPGTSTTLSHDVHKAAVSAGNHAGIVGFIAGGILGIANGSIAMLIVGALVGGGIGLVIQYRRARP